MIKIPFLGMQNYKKLFLKKIFPTYFLLIMILLPKIYPDFYLITFF